MNILRKHRLYAKPSWLFEQYWGEELSTIKMARMCDVTRHTINTYMERYGISRRTQKEAFAINMVEASFRDERWLRIQYWRKGIPIRGIAKLCGCDKKTIQYWMDKYDIRRRTKAEWQEDVIKANRVRYGLVDPSLFERLRGKITQAIKRFDEYRRSQDAVDN